MVLSMSLGSILDLMEKEGTKQDKKLHKCEINYVVLASSINFFSQNWQINMFFLETYLMYSLQMSLKLFLSGSHVRSS